MLSPEDFVRLRHMLDAARKAVQFSQRRSRSDLDANEVLALALVRLLEVIGETASGVSADVRERCPEIPWRQVVSTRNRLIHGYYDIDLSIIWGIVTHDLPPVITELKKLTSLGVGSTSEDESQE
jgi:uncharacterized protein with HEPN domain